jgi:hypothetical protein
LSSKNTVGWLRPSVGLAIVIALVGLGTARLKSPEPNIATRLIAATVALRSAQVVFAASCGRGGYATSLAQFEDTSFLEVPNIMFDGLHVEVHALPDGRPPTPDCHGSPTTRAFYATASAGRRWPGPTFGFDTNLVLWRSETATPPQPPFTAPGLSVVK